MKIEFEINKDGTLTYNGKTYKEVTKATQAIPIKKSLAKEKEKEKLFKQLVSGLIRKEDRKEYPNSVFWFDKNGKFMFEHDEKNKYFWCSYTRVWWVFESRFGMNYSEIQSFTKCMVEKHFKLNGVTAPYFLPRRLKGGETFQMEGSNNRD